MSRHHAALLLSLILLACRAPATGNASTPAAASAPASPSVNAPVSAAPASAAPAASTAPSQAGFRLVSAVLYQPDSTLAKRLADVKAMAAYNQAITQTCVAHFAEAVRPELLDVVVALRPGRSRVWFIAPSRAAGDADLAALGKKLERLPPPPLKEGPVVFALLASLGGAPREQPVAAQGYQPPMPAEWQRAQAESAEPLSMPDGLLAKVWP